MFRYGNIRHLPHTFSDHYPILINIDGNVRSKKQSSFKFEAWWLLEETLENEVLQLWEQLATSIFVKLERLSLRLNAWARDVKKKRVGLKK